MRLSKKYFHTVMSQTGTKMGLGPDAINQLVHQAQLGHWRRHSLIFGAEDRSDLVNFLVAGAVKVSCPTPEGPVCVQMIRPGQFFGLNWYPEPNQPRQFTATAFADSVVATVTSETMARIIANAPPRTVLQMLTYSWRALSGLLYEKCCLLSLDLEQRLLHELSILARDFGQPSPAGTVIDLALTHADLAEIALGSRANVARITKRFEREGRLARDGKRFVLTPQFFDRQRSTSDHRERREENRPLRAV